MHVAIIGSRGIPARYGGFETLAEQLAILLPRGDMKITVVGEKQASDQNFADVKVITTFFSKQKFPVLFYFESLLRVIPGNQVIVLLGVGAGPFLWLARLFNRKLITNVDGLEHLRDKYSLIRKLYVRIAQQATAWFSQQLIADSRIVADYWKQKYAIDEQRIDVISYGASGVKVSDDTLAVVKQYDVLDNSYYLVIARIVPENNIHLIIDGFSASRSEFPLLIIGNWNDSAYGRQLKRLASPKLRLIDAVYDTAVTTTLRQHCFAYLHGHTVGGTNPTLVEAMAAAAIPISHDNPFNREATENIGFFFQDECSLSAILDDLEKLSFEEQCKIKNAASTIALRKYNWQSIVNEYRKLILAE